MDVFAAVQKSFVGKGVKGGKDEGSDRKVRSGFLKRFSSFTSGMSGSRFVKLSMENLTNPLFLKYR